MPRPPLDNPAPVEPPPRRGRPRTDSPSSEALKKRRQRAGLVLVTIGPDRFELRPEQAERLRRSIRNAGWG